MDNTPYAPLASINIWDQVTKTAERLPEKEVFILRDERMTFNDLKERAGRLANALYSLNLKKGDMAAIYMPNSLELNLAFYAFQKLGVAVAWINPAYREKESSFILGDSKAKAVVAFESWQNFNYKDSLLSLKGSLPELEHIIVVSEKGDFGGEEGVLSFDELASSDAASVPHEDQDVKPDDLSMLLYTSGTTGKPKGAMIGQSQVLRAGLSYSLCVDAKEDDVFLGFLPMGHSYGCGALLVQPVVLGATVVMMDAFNPTEAFSLIERERVTLQPGAPAHYLMELAAKDRGDFDLSSLRAGMIAGQIAPAGLIKDVEEKMGVYISSFLGSSEVGPGNSIILPYGSPLEVREHFIGKPIPGTEVKIVDPVTGKEMGENEEGEIIISGWHVMKGYWNKPEETIKQLVDGWLHTGDLGVKSSSGNFKILGRLKDWINRGGFKIIPSELEAILVDQGNIAEVSVVSTPNPVLGESICVCAKLHDSDKGLTLAEVREFMKGKVAKFKLPDELLILDDFPRMPGGIKINRFSKGGLVEIATDNPAKESLH